MFQKSCIFAPQTCAEGCLHIIGGVADIFRRRLLALCSDELKLRNFQS